MKQRGKIVVLLALLVVLVGLQFARREPGANPAVTATAAKGARAGARPSLSAIPDSLLEVKGRKPDPRRRAAAQRHIFEYGRRAAVAPAPETAGAAPPTQPPPPPAPLRFYGFAEPSHGGKRQVFLTDGEEVYVAAEGDVVLRRYRVLRVGSQSIELEELSGKQRWVVPLEQP